MSKPVLVIGAGLAGLSLARTLLAQSVPVRIFDSLPQLRRHSYGVTLLPWACEPVVSRLNIGGETGLRRATSTDSKIGGLGLINSVGASRRPASGIPDGKRRPYRCSRSRLSEILSQGMDVEFNRKLKSINSSSAGVTVHFEGGETAEGILAVGADGVHSSVRKCILPEVNPALIPAMAINGSVNLLRSEFLAGIGKHMGDSQVIVGAADKSAVTISVSNHTESDVHLSWTFTWQPAEPNQYKSDRQSIDDASKIPSSFYDRLEEIGPLAEPFQSILTLDMARQTAKYNWLMRTVQVPLTNLLQAANKGIVMIGDAAHAMPIVAGEGANHALLDGVQLGDVLASSPASMTQAVQDVYEAQYERWEAGVARSTQCFSDLHNPTKQWLPLTQEQRS